MVKNEGINSILYIETGPFKFKYGKNNLLQLINNLNTIWMATVREMILKADNIFEHFLESQVCVIFDPSLGQYSPISV